MNERDWNLCEWITGQQKWGKFYEHIFHNWWCFSHFPDFSWFIIFFHFFNISSVTFIPSCIDIIGNWYCYYKSTRIICSCVFTVIWLSLLVLRVYLARNLPWRDDGAKSLLPIFVGAVLQKNFKNWRKKRYILLHTINCEIDKVKLRPSLFSWACMWHVTCCNTWCPLIL